MLKSLPALVLTLLVLGLPAPASAAGKQPATARADNCASVIQSGKFYGVMDDAAEPQQVVNACFNVLKETVWLTPTNWQLDKLNSKYLDQLDQRMQEAKDLNLKVIFELWVRMRGSVMFPLSTTQQRLVCDVGNDLAERYPDQTLGIQIGNEPNSPGFWRPQFGPDGRNVSAAAYESWLAACYARIKPAHPDVMIIGGSLASHGNDDPSKGVGAASTSPVAFIQKMCAAYKASGDTQPLMDVFDMHSYEDNLSDPPSTVHPYPSTTIDIADYDKLEDLLGCFAGTPQPIPKICWCETGVDSLIPAGRQDRYRHAADLSKTAPDETTQGEYYAQEIQMAYCQPNTIGIIKFLLIDQAEGHAWQSGLFYAIQATGTPSWAPRSKSLIAKQSLLPVQAAAQAAENGTLQC